LKSGSENNVGSNRRRLAVAPAADEPAHQREREQRPCEQQHRDRLAAFLPGQDAQDQQRHAQDRQDRPDDVDAAVPAVGHVADQPGPEQNAGDDHRFEQETHTPRQQSRHQPPSKVRRPPLSRLPRRILANTLAWALRDLRPLAAEQVAACCR